MLILLSVVLLGYILSHILLAGVASRPQWFSQLNVELSELFSPGISELNRKLLQQEINRTDSNQQNVTVDQPQSGYRFIITEFASFHFIRKRRKHMLFQGTVKILQTMTDKR